MRATTIIRLAARAGMTIEVRADRDPGSNRRSRRKILQQRDRKDLKEGDLASYRGLASFEKYGQLIQRLEQVLLLWDLCELLFKTLSSRASVELVVLACGLDSMGVAQSNHCDFYVNGYLPIL